MKNNILIILSVFLFTFISCNKDEETTKISNGSAKITGIAKCDLDLTSSEAEYAPVGTKIIATINTGELVMNPVEGTVYPKKLYTTTVGENGAYSLNIEANAKTVNVQITASDFEYDKKINDSTFVRTIYVYPGGAVSVVNGVSKINDIFFN